EANTKVGVLGIKVWICNGEVYGKRDLSPNVGVNANAGSANQGGRNDRRGGRNDRRGGNRKGGKRANKEQE
ncbi:MAG: 30S ribosomal protein S3, partial [Bacteroidales bacterium]|nr:30S ribosomal protein S3 [Bacteroidales bacterium]